MTKIHKYVFLIISFISLVGCSKNDNQIIVETNDGLSIDKVEIRKGFTSGPKRNS